MSAADGAVMDRLHRIPIGAKLALCFALLIALVAATTLFVQSNLSTLNGEAKTVGDRSVPFDQALGDIAVTVKAMANDERGYMMEPDQEYLDSIDERADSVAANFDTAAAVAPTAQLRAQIARIRGDYETWLAALRDELALAETDRAAARTQALTESRDTRRAFEALIGEAQQASGAEVTRAFDVVDDKTASIRTILWGVLVLLAVASGLIGFVLLRTIRSTIRPALDALGQVRDGEIASLRTGLDAMAGGDLTRDIEATTEPIVPRANDDLGAVAKAVEEIRADAAASVGAYRASRESLAELVGRVSESATGVSSASAEMAGTSEEAGRAVGEIAGAVAEVATGAERQTRMIETARATADETRRAAQSASEVAERGAAASSEAAAAMGAVRAASEEANTAIRSLADKSGEISGIVDTISGIAEQTNLLALNAAIEAARAGEQGRGFAVVADEVRKLAEESQQAAGSIAALIEQIAAETDGAVGAVETGAQRSQEGASVVEAARASFAEIAAAVTDVAGRIDEIARATEEVAAVAEQSSASAQEVSASTEQTSASTQQIAASAQELAGTARGLEELVGRFRLAAR